MLRFCAVCSAVVCLACGQVAVRRAYPTVVTSSDASRPLPAEVIDADAVEEAARVLASLGMHGMWVDHHARALAARLAVVAPPALAPPAAGGLPRGHAFHVAVAPGRVGIDAVCDAHADARCE